MPHVITGSCCGDARCVAACPLDCIHPRPDEPGFATAEMLHVDPATCIDCGACADACPVDAIAPLSKLPVAQHHYKAVNADYFAGRPASGQSIGPVRAIPVLPGRGRLRVAVVGSGPAGMYAAEELLRHRRAEVDVYERLLTPWGLVRSGVAPDHPETKAVARTFELLAREDNLRLRLGVEIGRDLAIEELRRHYHAVIVATGAAHGRTLAVPGADLAGSLSATDLAQWYNGHPDFAGRAVDLSGDSAVVIGNGNVALDIARLLITDPTRLNRTDIADHALKALAHSRFQDVLILGRRGPRFAACTEPELAALARMGEGSVEADSRSLVAGDLDWTECDPPHVRRKLALLRSPREAAAVGGKRVRFGFHSTVVAILGDERVRAVEIEVRTSSGSEHRTVPADLVVHAIGHDSRQLPGVPFDPVLGRTPHRNGRVLQFPGGPAIPGLYTVGWHKRGASGVIGTNRFCSQETVAALLDDFAADLLTPPAGTVDALLAKRGVRPLDRRNWHRLDREEQRRGRVADRPRIKLVDPVEQAAVARR
ncbi:FAD-dependent oxidoreductase [Nocardia sp. NPDC051832]|uniref:FAD-dependent oxidoreductase n=1 Tax=Nocardia sp. NPDC051832 TaxID=3155673 RepID=UPI00341F61B6